MASLLSNFVTARKTKGDLLTPIEFRTIVEMILGILKTHDYAGLNDHYKLFLAHILDFNDPHHDTNTSFLNEIIAKTYSVYVNMTAEPLSFADFTTQIAPTVSFVELCRRIVLNRLAYTQVKRLDGTVPRMVTFKLNQDWGFTATPVPPISIDFGRDLISENDFIQQGWKAPTSPYPIIFTANALNPPKLGSSVIFETSSVSSYFAIEDVGTGYPFLLQNNSNDMVIHIDTVNAPLITVSLLTLMNPGATIVVQMDTHNKVYVSVNGTKLSTTGALASNGKITLLIDRLGTITLKTGIATAAVTTVFPAALTDLRILSMASIGVPTENLILPVFGLRSLIIARA